MKRKKLLMILALLCATVQGAWAQASWDEVYAMTHTTTEPHSMVNSKHFMRFNYLFNTCELLCHWHSIWTLQLNRKD